MILSMNDTSLTSGTALAGPRTPGKDPDETSLTFERRTPVFSADSGESAVSLESLKSILSFHEGFTNDDDAELGGLSTFSEDYPRSARSRLTAPLLCS